MEVRRMSATNCNDGADIRTTYTYLVGAWACGYSRLNFRRDRMKMTMS
jgi:hypothetical protein